MSETKDAVDRLRWLCEEAVCRAEGATDSDFTSGLACLAKEVRSLSQVLQAAGIVRAENETLVLPFEFDSGCHVGKPLKRLANGKLCDKWWAIWTVDPLSPSDKLGIFVYCRYVVETRVDWDDFHNEAGKTVKDFDTKLEWISWTGTDNSFDSLSREQYRDLLIEYLRRWTRFLYAESLTLQTSTSTEKDSTSKNDFPQRKKATKSKAKKQPGRERLIAPLELRKKIREMKQNGRTVKEIQRWLMEEKKINVATPTIYSELSKED